METRDILGAAQQLEESGMERAEAESVIRTMQSMVAPLATKESTAAESKAIREEMAAEFKLVRKEMEALEHKLVAMMHELATAQTWRLVGAVFVINGMFFALQQMFG